jgi:hypothetical protein
LFERFATPAPAPVADRSAQSTEDPVQIDELFHSCSNAHVARAALASIGGDLALRVERAAFIHGVPAGVFAAVAVRKFGRAARPQERAMIVRAMCGADQPILRGLRVILETVIEAGSDDDDGEDELTSRRPFVDWSKAALRA